MTFFQTIKDFVLKRHPAVGSSEIWGVVVKHSDTDRDGYSLSIGGYPCDYHVTANEDKDGKETTIEAEETCGWSLVHIDDKNADGRIEKGEKVTGLDDYYTRRRRPRLNPNEFYQTVVQRKFFEAIEGISEIERFVSPEVLRDKSGVLIFGKDAVLARSAPSRYADVYYFLEEALKKTRAILEKVRPNLEANKAIAFKVDSGVDSFVFRFDENGKVPVIYLPPAPKVGHSVLIGFILTLLNIPKEGLDEEGKRAIEMFTAYLEMKGGSGGLLDYLFVNKIYPAHLAPMMEERVLAKVDEPYQKALKGWRDDVFGEPTLRLLEEARRELAKRPPPSDSDHSLALGQRAKEIDALFNKVQRLKKQVEEKNIAEIIRLLETEGFIHPGRFLEKAKASGQFHDVKITGASWHKEGHLLLDVEFQYRCGDHNRLLKDAKPQSWPYSLHHFRRLEGKIGQYDLGRGERCIESAPAFSLTGGLRVLEYDQLGRSAETLFGGERIELSYLRDDGRDAAGNGLDNIGDGFALGWSPLSGQFDFSFRKQRDTRAFTLRAGAKVSYQREELNGGGPHNILKAGYTGEVLFHPFYAIPHLSRLSLGVGGDAGIIAGAAFKDGWLRDVRWVPVWGGLRAVAGVDF